MACFPSLYMGTLGAGSVTESGSDWAQHARLVFRQRCDWTDVRSPHPQAVPRTRWMLKGCAQPVFRFRGSLSVGLSSPIVGAAEGTLLPFPEKKLIFFVAPEQDT